MAKYQGVIFDLDGTLSDSIEVILKCAELTQKELGVPWDEEKQRSLIGTPLYQSAAIICGEQHVERYLKLFRGFSEQYLSKLIRPYPGAVELVKALHQQGVKMAVVTSRLKWGADISCQVLGLTPYLTAIVAVEDTNTHKPDPEPALLALEKMGVLAEQAVFVGDSPVDIRCGQNADTQSIAVGWGITNAQVLKECKPTHFCNSPSELAALLLS